jgi:N-methylhydantoinase A
LVREVGIGTMLVPKYPGVLCAMGCAIADVRYDFSQTLERRLDEIEPGQIAAIMEAQAEKGKAQLKANNLSIEDISVGHVADMSYSGQIHSLRVPIQRDWPAARMREAFLEAYRQEFGNTLGEIPVVIVNLRTVATGKRRVAASSIPMPVSQGAPTPRRRRQVHFGVPRDTPIYHRDDLLPGHRFEGPAVVEQTDTTTLIEPGMEVKVDAAGNLLVGVK